MTITRKLTAATITALLAGAGIAAAADAPIVSKQHTSTAGTAPLTIPGSGLKKGDRLPTGARLVYRNVTLEGDQTATFNIKAIHGKRLRGLGTKEGQDVGFVVVNRASYAGRTKVQVRAYANPNADGEVEGRIYGLVR
ncbi:MAG: hypothetical protein Q8K79_01235 [Solirubrobacteraceae bacterium]|nr:hypothetical protein [Solirubrobacteraceae bacterium]